MSTDTVLLRVTEGSRERLELMNLDDFLQAVRLYEWNTTVRFVGVILPAATASAGSSDRYSAVGTRPRQSSAT